MDVWEALEVRFYPGAILIEPIETIDEPTLKSIFPEGKVELNIKRARCWEITRLPENAWHRGSWALISHFGRLGWQLFSYHGSIIDEGATVVLRRNQSR